MLTTGLSYREVMDSSYYHPVTTPPVHGNCLATAVEKIACRKPPLRFDLSPGDTIMHGLPTNAIGGIMTGCQGMK